jgi:hypothetical protein
MASFRRQTWYLISIAALSVVAVWVYPTSSFVKPTTAVIKDARTEKAFFTHGTNTTRTYTSTSTSTSHTPLSSNEFNQPPPYPLAALNLTSARTSFEKGFWQRMKPVPLDRWEAASNTTCVRNSNSTFQLEKWHYRVPYVILIGAQKGGSTALAYYLYNHPSIQYLPTKELHYFDEEMDKNRELQTIKGGIPAAKSLDHFQQKVLDERVPLEKFKFETNRALDATPNYLFASDRVPNRLFCTAPWVKLLALLRNPVDRLFSHYHMQFNRDLAHPMNRRGYSTFEEYVELDLQVLRDTGVVHDWTTVDFHSFSGSPQEFQAWKTYTKLGLNAPVGRGLYAIQLRHWFQAMEEYGKPRSELWIAPSERLLQAPNETYADVLAFLGLTPHPLGNFGKIHATPYRTLGMAPATRAKLQAFYEPYNRQLESLLGSEWHGIWE